MLLAGCCANNACNCDDLFADALYFKFDPKSFTAADIDTVYLLRYNNANAQQRPDSVALIYAQRRSTVVIRRLLEVQLDTTTLVLSNNVPFNPAAAGGKLNQYNYQLRVREGNSRLGRVYTYVLNRIALTGRYQADGCCTCYENTLKTVNVSTLGAATGAVYNVTETGSSPTPILLSK